MRLKDIQEILPDYRYKTPPYNGIVENEICPVFAAHADSDVLPNPDEVEAYRWLSWPIYEQELRNNPDNYSYWAKDQYKQLVKNSTFKTRWLGETL